MSDVELTDAERAAHVSDARRCMRLSIGVAYATVRGLLRALDEAEARLSQERERLDVVVSANTEQARYIRGLQGRLTEVASVAEDRGETIQALMDEAERVRAERDREWRRAVEALVEQYREIAFLGYDPADPVVKYVSATKVADRLRRLAQDGPRPAQEGEQ